MVGCNKCLQFLHWCITEVYYDSMITDTVGGQDALMSDKSVTNGLSTEGRMRYVYSYSQLMNMFVGSMAVF